MKFATGRVATTVRVLAEVDGTRIVDVNTVLEDDDVTLHTIIDSPADVVRSITDRIRAAGDDARVAESDVVFLPPVPAPSKIVGVALNNDVFNYLASRTMTAPMYFLSPATAMTGHGGRLRVDPAWGPVHPEPELAAVIGSTLSCVTPSDALAGVFGYTIINDVTSPGLKSDDSVELVMPQGITVDEPWRESTGDDDRSLYLTYHARSKGTDTFAPIGPWVVTPDDVGSPDDLTIRAFLDDELVLEDSTANLTFAVGDVLSHLSHSMTLVPGDIVHFGTAARPSNPDRFPTIRSIDLTKYGQTVSIEIDGLGRLDTTITRTAMVSNHPY